MLKFFRKYNKIILVIGGAFLMVSFLLMDSIGRLGGQLGLSQAYAKVEGKTIDRGAFQESVNELQVVRRIAPEILQLIGIDTSNITDHWFLLTYEAEKAGLIGGPGDGGAEFIETAAGLLADRQAQMFAQQAALFGENAGQFIQQQRTQTYNMVVERYASERTRLIQTGQPERSVDMALAKMRAIIRLLESQPGADTLSRPEALAYAGEIFDTAVTRMGVIPSNALDTVFPEASDDEIAAHFETYKSQRPEDNDLGIGYLLEPAVKLEFVTIDRQGIITALTPSVDEIEVNKYWRANKSRFGEDWSAAKANATNAYVSERADEILNKAIRVAQREQRRVTRNLERDGKYYVLPADWDSQKLSLETLAAVIRSEMSDEFAFDMPYPGYTAPVSNWLDAEALVGLRGLGSSTWSLNEATRVPFTDLMMNVRSLGGNAELGIQENVTFGPLRSPSGVYFVRVTAARGEGAPETIDSALRTKIVADIRAIKQFEDLKANADSFRSRLVAGDFDAVFGEIAPGSALQAVEVTRRVVARPGMTVPMQRYDDEGVRTAIMDRVSRWDPLADVTAEVPMEERVFVLPLPGEKGLIAALVTARLPLTYEDLHASSVSVRAVAMEKRAEALQMAPFTLEALQKRNGVVFLDQSGDARDLKSEAEGEDEAPADES